MGECFPSWRNTQGRNSSPSYRGLCRARWRPACIHGTPQPCPVPGPHAEGGLLGPVYPGGPSPLLSPRVLSRGAVNTCLVLGLRRGGWSQGPWGRLLLAGAAGGFHSYFFRVRISSWPLRAWRKPHLSPTRVHWVYIFICLRTRLGYTFFLR